MWLQIVIALLKIIIAVVKSRSDEEQKEIGRNEIVKQLLADIAVRSGVARKIEIDSLGWDREHIDSILHNNYRD